jgi:hypothetical protein
MTPTEEYFDDNTPVVELTLPDSAKKRNKALHTNHPCALCDTYGHYSHHCPELPKLKDALAVIHQIDAIPKVASTSPTSNDNSASICYISTLVGSMSYDAQSCSFDIHISNPLVPSVPLTSSRMTPSSTTLASVGVSYVGQTSCTYGTACGSTFSTATSMMISDPSGSSTPIFHSDEEILEALNTPNYPWDDNASSVLFPTLGCDPS